MIELVIFDLDGTLIKLPVRYDFLRNELRDNFNIQGESFLIPMILEKTQDNNKVKREAFELICKEECNAINGLGIHEGAIEAVSYTHLTLPTILLV